MKRFFVILFFLNIGLGALNGQSQITVEPMGFVLRETPTLAQHNYWHRFFYLTPHKYKFFKGFALPIEALSGVEIILDGLPANNYNNRTMPKENAIAHKHLFPLTHRTYKEEFFRETMGEVSYRDPNSFFTYIEP